MMCRRNVNLFPPASALARHGLRVLLAVALCLTAATLQAAGPSGLALSDATPLLSGASCGCEVRPEDEVWVVSTRGVADPRCSALQTPAVRRYACELGWLESSFDELCAAAPLLTVVYVHGNRFTYSDSLESGWTVYRLLTRCGSAPPLRLVIWSWPSEQVSGPVRDARIKSDRAYFEGYFLAWYLGRMVEPAPLSLVGYSFGARIVVAALDGLQRGQVEGVGLPAGGQSAVPPARVALLAAAVDTDALQPRGRYPAAVNLMDELLVTFNALDPALRRYNLLERRRFDRAMGAVGVAERFSSGVRIQQMNATREVGRSHAEDRYYASPWLAEGLRRNLLWYAP